MHFAHSATVSVPVHHRQRTFRSQAACVNSSYCLQCVRITARYCEIGRVRVLYAKFFIVSATSPFRHESCWHVSIHHHDDAPRLSTGGNCNLVHASRHRQPTQLTVTSTAGVLQASTPRFSSRTFPAINTTKTITTVLSMPSLSKWTPTLSSARI